MNEIDKTKLTHQTKYRLNEITKIENYFNQKINQRKTCSKRLSKYVAAFDHIDKIYIVLSTTSGGVCIISSVSFVGAPAEIPGARFTLIFSLTTEIIKILLSMTRNKKKNHDKILMFAKSKLNSIETLVSQTLIDMEISHEEFDTIMKEEKNMRRWKKSEECQCKKQEGMRLKSVNSKA